MSIKWSAGIVAVSGLAVRPISVAVEDVRHSMREEDLAKDVRQFNDKFNAKREAALEDSLVSDSSSSDVGQPPMRHEEVFETEFSNDVNVYLPIKCFTEY